MAVKTKAPPPHLCCVVCSKVCDPVLWPKGKDRLFESPAPVCGKHCLLQYYSKKGLIDDIELEGLTEEMSIKKIEDTIRLYIRLDTESREHNERQRDTASASSGEFEVIEDVTGRMQLREEDPEVIRARQRHVSDMMTQSGLVDSWLRLGPGQALAFRWVDEEGTGRTKSRLVMHRVPEERVMPRNAEEVSQHTATVAGFNETLSSSNTSDETSARLPSTSSNPGEPEDEPDAPILRETCHQCGSQIDIPYWTTLVVPEIDLPRTPTCSEACMLDYSAMRSGAKRDWMVTRLDQYYGRTRKVDTTPVYDLESDEEPDRYEEYAQRMRIIELKRKLNAEHVEDWGIGLETKYVR